MNKTVTTFLFLISTSFCFGQHNKILSKKNSFQLDLGLNQLKEENLHPKVHSGFIYGLSYTNLRTSLHQKRFRFGIQFSRLKTKYESTNASMNIQLNIGYSYLFEMVAKNKFTFSFGPELVLHYNLSHYPNWDESHLYWSDHLVLGVQNKLKYQLNNDQQITLDFTLPFVSVISRPDLNRMYKIDDISLGGVIKSMHSNLEGSLCSQSLAITSRLEYHFKSSNRVSQAICYSFNYSKILVNEGAPFQNVQHLLGLKLSF